jgi:hypothetical protein
MTLLLITHLLAVAVGAIGAGAYARSQIVKIKRDDLSFRMAPIVPHSVEDAIRRAGC